jgi:hypothetical protein
MIAKYEKIYNQDIEIRNIQLILKIKNKKKKPYKIF